MEENNRPSYFAIIPARVRYDKDLCANAKLMYGEITALSNEYGYCFASNDYFSKLYGVSVTSIITWIKQLDSKNYIFKYNYYIRGRKDAHRRVLFVMDSIDVEVIKEKFKNFLVVNKEKFNHFTEVIKEKFKSNSIVNINNIINKLIEDKDLSKEKFKKSSIKINKKFINLINLLKEKGFKFIFDKEKIPSKRLQEVQKYFEYLLSDQFIRLKFSRDYKKAYLRIKRINDVDSLEKYLRMALDNFNMMKKKEYWPVKKEVLPKEINKFFYNPKTKKSWFLMCLNEVPNKIELNLSDSIKANLKRKTVNFLIDFQKPHWTNGYDSTYWKKIKEIKDWFDEKFDGLVAYHSYIHEKSFDSYFPDFHSLVKEYVDFLNSWESISLGNVGYRNKTWSKFVEHIEKKRGLFLHPDKEKIEKSLKAVSTDDIIEQKQQLSYDIFKLVGNNV